MRVKLRGSMWPSSNTDVYVAKPKEEFVDALAHKLRRFEKLVDALDAIGVEEQCAECKTPVFPGRICDHCHSEETEPWEEARIV